jgi:hypothetical protein
VQLGILLLLVSFYQPLFLPLGLPLVKLLGGANASHYPVLYFALPGMFFRAGIAINVLLASIVVGAATLQFSKGYGGRTESSPWRKAWRCAPTLVAASLVETALVVGVSQAATLVPHELVRDQFWIRWGTRGGVLFLSILVQSFLAYTTAWVVLMNQHIVSAVRNSIRVATRTVVPTVLVVAIPAVVLYPFSYASSRIDFFSSRLRPEMLAGLLAVEVATQVLMTFLVVGGITRLFLWRTEAAR